jgi:hypothetical protein
MLVLVRRGGVDLLVTNLTHEAMTNQDGLLSVQTHNPGDDFVEYHYTNAGEDIHSKVIAAVKNLVESGTLGGSYLKKVGLSRSEWAAHHAKPNGTDVVFDEDKVRYAEFTIVETNDIGYELLDPEDTASPQRIRDLQECLRGGIIRSLTIKYGICFAAYADGRHRSHALMDYSVAHKLGGRVPIHPPRQQTRGQYRTVLRGLDEYCHLESDSTHLAELRLLCGPELPREFHGPLPESEFGRNLVFYQYRTLAEDHQVFYAQFVNVATGKFGYELLNPECHKTPQMLDELKQHLRQGKISRLAVKTGVCYVVYNESEWKCHIPMDYSAAGAIGKLVGNKYHPERPDFEDEEGHYPQYAVDAYFNRLDTLENGYSSCSYVELKCGPRMPRDSCGTDCYDAGYGPHEGFSGSSD